MSATAKPFNLANIDASLVAVYTCPASTIAVVTSLIIANVLGADTTVDITLTNAATAAVTYLGKALPLPAASSLIVIGDANKQALNAGDIIKVKGGTTDSVDATGSVLEQGV